jgi:hypothetical protein
MTKLIAAFYNFVNAPKKNVLWGDHVRPPFFFECDLVSANKLRLISMQMGVWSPLQDRCLASMSYRKIGKVTVTIYVKAQMSFYPHCPHVSADTCAISTYEQSTSHTLPKGVN